MKSKRKVLLAITIPKQSFMRGIVRYAREHDWHLVMDMLYTGRVPLGWRGDGILTILGYRKELVDFVLKAGIPTVAITQINQGVALPRVEGDNVRIGELAAGHFLERGYRHFAWAPFLNDVMDIERLEGFRHTLAPHGFGCHVLPLSHHRIGRHWAENWAGRRQGLVRELKRLPTPTAIFCYNDAVAADIIDACRDANLLVPEQIAVLGVDNDPDVCGCAPVPISSVLHDLEGMAYEGAALLDRLMSGYKPPRKYILRLQPKGIITRVSTDILAVENVNIALALRYLAKHHSNPLLSVGDVVAATNIAGRQLQRVFAEEMGCSLHEHLIRIRLDQVKKRLTETDDTIASIALQTGFANVSHLFRTFRLRFATSPKRFRSCARAASLPLVPEAPAKPAMR